MSEQTHPKPYRVSWLRRKGRRRDDGMTLPELLVGVALMGLVMAALSSAVIVILRQTDNTDGRLNNARSETGIGLWMPADLASAAENADGKLVVTAAGASPCFDACPAGFDLNGSNAMMLEWTTTMSDGADAVNQTTRVSYRYALVGDEYQMIRFECVLVVGGVQTCQSFVVLHDLDAPPDGVFVSGTTVPSWIITVKDPYKPDATTDDQTDPGLISKNSSRVVVTINGGGDAAGAGGGSNQISISAGGTNRTMIDGTSVQGAPTLIAARSRCGGPITLIVDESTSIGSTAVGSVKTSVLEFIKKFEGTPVKLQIVRFADNATVMGTNTDNPWVRYFNMLDEDEVTELKAIVGTLKSSGHTNWEDALYRTFRMPDGTPQTVIPKMVVFFTDGVPTFNRKVSTTATGPLDPPAATPGYPTPITSSNTAYDQASFDRANSIAAIYRDSIRFIGVGVGPDIELPSNWITGVNGYHYDYFRNFHYEYARKYHYDYARNFHYDYSRKYHYEYARQYHYDPIRWYHVERSFHYQTRTSTSSSTWTTVNKSVYDAQQNTDLKRTRVGVPTGTNDYWEDDPTATASTASITVPNGQRVSFAAPFSFPKTVTASALPTPERATSWTATTPTPPYATNQAAFDAQNIAAAGDASNTDGWTKSTTKVYAAPFTNTDNLGTTNTGYDSSDASWIRTKVYTAPLTLTDSLGQNGTGYNAADPSWVISAKLYSSPYTFSEPAASSSGYSSSDLSWSRVKNYTAPFADTDSNVSGTGYAAADPSWVRTQVYSSPYDQQEPSSTGGTGYTNNKSWTRSSKIYSAPFTDGYDAPTTAKVANNTILARLIAGSDTGTPAILNPAKTGYTNAAAANMYVLPEWSQFQLALTDIALAECGGTLTLQTRLGSKGAPDPFTYQKSKVWNSSGTQITSDQTIVTTTRNFASGTFDLATTTHLEIEIQPANLSDLSIYNPGTWWCKAGSSPVAFDLVNITGSQWKGIKLKVYANQAVSCTQTVTLKS